MAIVYDKLLALKIPDVEHSYGPKDCMLYALGLGLGYDPVDEDQLAFVYEKNLKVLPTMAVVIGHPGFWVKDLDTGIDWVRVVAGEYSVTLHQPLKPRGTVISKTRVTEIIDKGEGKGAVLYSERTIDDKATGARIATHPAHDLLPRRRRLRRAAARSSRRRIRSRSARPISSATCRPGRRWRWSTGSPPTRTRCMPTRRWRRRRASRGRSCTGSRPIGVAGHALLKSVCGYDPAKLTAIAGRFSAPVFPGETIRTEMWRDGAVVSFRSRVVERDVVAINNGRAEIAL